MNVPRRQFVRLSLGAGIGALGARFGLGAQDTPTGRARAKSCILLWMAGGPSQVDTFDLKPGLTPFKEIESASEARISEHLPRVARQMKRVSLVRTVHSRDPNHATATYLLHTAYRKAADLDHPHLGSVLVNELGEKSDLPGCVVIGCDPQSGAGYLPGEKGPVVFDRIEAPGEDVKPAVSRERLQRRWSLLSSLDERFGREREERAVEERRRAYERAYRVLTSDRVKAFDLSGEDPSRYGGTPFGSACLTARRLVEAGVRFVEVALGDWDSHAKNAEAHEKLMRTLDPAWSALVSDLADRRMLEETMVVWMGEFGRTPRENGSAGRDHFTKCWSVALSGGGIAGGRVIGRTDGMEIQDRPVSVQDLLASVYSAFGVDPAKEHLTPGGRPVRIVDGGTPVAELF